ncbi:MAG: hypothetical protein JW940_38505 [Polyangiaceae bacterium]|nr:hypothetical protein [Polyangiaceae bacterium]
MTRSTGAVASAVTGGLLGAALLLVVCPRAALAQVDTDVPRASTGPPRVDLVVVGEGPTLQALPWRITSWFGGAETVRVGRRVPRLDPGVVLTPRGERGVSVWVVLEKPGRVRLFFSLEEGSGLPPRYLASDVALAHGLDEVGMEQVAQVAYLSTMALWEGRLETTSRQEMQRRLSGRRPDSQPRRSAVVTGERSVNQRARRSLELRPGLGYGARWRGPLGMAHGPVVGFGLSSAGSRPEIGGQIRGQWLLPTHPEEHGIELDLRGYACSLGLTLGHRATDRVTATAELGPSLEIIRRRTRSVPSDYARVAGDVKLRPAMFLALGARADLGPASLGGAFVTTAAWYRTRYQYLDEPRPKTLFTAWIVQPGLWAELSW